MRWLGGVRTEAEQRESIGRMMRWQAERGFTFWVVERKADGALLGFCGLKLADTPGSPIEGMHEIGWRLREDVWGQGYAKRSGDRHARFRLRPARRGARGRDHLPAERSELGADGAARHDPPARARL